MKMMEEANMGTTVLEQPGTEATQNIEIPDQSAGYLLLKRCFDFLSSFCVSMILLVPLAILCLMIVVSDPGCPFYIQKRVGQHGKVFGMVKLRRMRRGADKLENMLTPEQLAQYKKEYKHLQLSAD